MDCLVPFLLDPIKCLKLTNYIICCYVFHKVSHVTEFYPIIQFLKERNTRAKDAELQLQREIEALNPMWLQSSNNKPQVVNNSDSVITDANPMMPSINKTQVVEAWRQRNSEADFPSMPAMAHSKTSKHTPSQAHAHGASQPKSAPQAHKSKFTQPSPPPAQNRKLKYYM